MGINELEINAEFTHRHYVSDNEYIQYGEDIEEFLTREIGKQIIRWQDSPQLGYEILPISIFISTRRRTQRMKYLRNVLGVRKRSGSSFKRIAESMRSHFEDSSRLSGFFLVPLFGKEGYGRFYRDSNIL